MCRTQAHDDGQPVPSPAPYVAPANETVGGGPMTSSAGASDSVAPFAVQIPPSARA